MSFNFDDEKLAAMEAKKDRGADLNALKHRIVAGAESVGTEDFVATVAESLQLAYLTGCYDTKQRLTGISEAAHCEVHNVQPV